MPSENKNGVYLFRRTGCRYYLRWRPDGVRVYRGDRPTYMAYCGTCTPEEAERDYMKPPRRSTEPL